MYCEYCGNKIDGTHKFCTKCGNPIISEIVVKSSLAPNLDQKWWLRLVKVIYILLYIPLPFALFGIWTLNDPYSYYSSYSREWHYSGSYSEAFWYSLLTLVIWVMALRLAKIIFLYISFAQKPEWKKELKKFF